MRNMKASKLFISFLDVKDIKLVPGKEFTLDNNDIVIYTIYLPDFIEFKSDLSTFLNTKELNRAQRYYKELDQNRFIIYRSILKLLLAAYTKLDVKNVYLDYQFNKKPYLTSHPWLYFNISHSEDFAVIAISRKKVGLDIEYLSEDFEFTNFVPDVFEDNEILTIQNAVNKKKAFYTSWTRKEAFVKALGKGIDEDFKYIPSLEGQHILDFALIQNSQNWQVYSFDFADHYLAAVAFEGLSTVSKNVVLCSVPNTLQDLLKMTQTKK